MTQQHEERSPGRPCINAGEKTHGFSISLTPSEAGYLKKLGQGNLTKGIRKLMCYQVDPINVETWHLHDQNFPTLAADGLLEVEVQDKQYVLNIRRYPRRGRMESYFDYEIDLALSAEIDAEGEYIGIAPDIFRIAQ